MIDVVYKVVLFDIFLCSVTPWILIDVHFFICSYESTYHKVPFEQIWEKSLWGESVISGTEKRQENISFLVFVSKLGGPLQMFMGEIIEYSST